MLKKDFPRSALTFIIIIIIFGASLSGFGIKNLIESYQSRSWPTVTGKIISSSKHTSLDDDGITRYEVSISYDYIIDSKELYAHEYYRLTQAEADLLIEKYPQDSLVEVFYNPEDPRKTILQPGSQGGWLLTFVGLFFILLSASFLIFAIKTK